MLGSDQPSAKKKNDTALSLPPVAPPLSGVEGPRTAPVRVPDGSDGFPAEGTPSLARGNILSPGGREGPLLSQSAIVNEAMQRLATLHPNLTTFQSDLVRRATMWAVAYETETNNTIIRNSNPDEIGAAILDRRRPEFLHTDSAALFEKLRSEFAGVDRHAHKRQGYVHSPEALARWAVGRVKEQDSSLTDIQREDIHATISWAIAAETEINNLLLHDHAGGTVRDCLVKRVRPGLVVTNPDGTPLKERTTTEYWSEWFCGLDNGHLTLRAVYQTLPGFPADKVPSIVRKFENPDSPDALPGAVTLLRHDLIHILLGRGLLDQDEAFVIGFTMGTAKEALTEGHVAGMKDIFSRQYPEPYRIAEEDLIAYDLGVRTGREMGIRDLYKVVIEELMDQPIGEVRKALGIDEARLREIYREEARKIPNTLESARLPI